MTNKSKGRLLVSFPFGCNMNCLFCLRNANRNRPALKRSAGQWRLLLQKLHALMRLVRKRGPALLCLGGDEPTVAPAWLLDAVLALGVKEGFENIELMSNAFKLGDKGYCGRLAAAGVNTFSLPVYGPSAALHDAVTQKKGSYAALRKAIRNIRALPGTQVKLHTVPVKANGESIGAIVAGMAKLGLKCEIYKLNKNDADRHVNYPEITPGGVLPERQQAVDSGVKKNALFVRYNICTGEVY